MGARRWPPIPRYIEGLAGPIRVVVRRVEEFRADDGDPCWGLYRPAKRRIDIAGKLPPALRWHSLIHEAAHAWILDCGLQNKIKGEGADLEDNIEVFCDTLASMLIRTLARQYGVDPWEGAKRP